MAAWGVAVSLLFLLQGILAIENLSTKNKTEIERCGEDEFRCLDYTCVLKTKKCDGRFDCYLQEDESDCGCQPGFFHCKGGHCISEAWVCDGTNDCHDFSDEQNCTTKVIGGPVNCTGGQFGCGGLCILPEWMCDGTHDCLNGEDEQKSNCASKNKICEATEFECAPDVCIPHRWLCDGTPDCPNAKDEGDQCGDYREDCRLELGYFKCPGNGTSSRCLDGKHVCDGVPQCSNQEDEGPFCKKKGCGSAGCLKECIESPKGPVCYCPEGLTLGSNGQDCVDIDECKEYGRCSQRCINSVGNYTCSCDPGFKLINSTCFASGGDVIVYLSTENSIRSYNIRTNVYRLVKDKLDNVVGVGYDGLDDRVYWTDVRKNQEQIESVRSNGQNRRVLVNHGLDMPEDIVVDEAGRTFYFSDSIKGHIGVCSLDGTFCSVLVTKNEHPRGLAIHSREKLLFYSDWGSKPVIVKLGLDGSERTDLVTTGLHWPNGVAVDQILDRVYWSDAKLDQLESVLIDGSDRRLVLQEINMLHPFSLAIFEDTLYWSDWSGGMLASCNKFTGKEKKIILKEAGMKIMGVTVWHPQMRSQLENPCKGNLCSHLCLPRPRRSTKRDLYTCVCPSDMALDQDNRTCRFNNSNSLIVTVNSQLYRMYPHKICKSCLEPVGFLTGKIGSVAPDLLKGNLYVNDDSNTIYKIDVQKSKKVAISTQTNVASLVFDPVNENLYWIDSQRKSIMVQSVLTKSTRVLITNLTNPRLLVFTAKWQKLIFLDERRLVSTSSNGSKQTTLSSSIPKSVRVLNYVETNNTLLMADTNSKIIYQFFLGSREMSVFLAGVQSLASMGVYNGYFYWSQWGGSEIFWIKFVKGVTLSNVTWMTLDVSKSPLDLITLSVSSNNTAEYQGMDLPCSKAGCQQFCFLTNGKAECSCELGHNLKADNKSCQDGCPSNLYSCKDDKNRCIKPEWVCDKNPDCLNGADEVNCTKKENCDPKTAFLCKSGECLRDKSYRCDQDADCADGSDEQDCPPVVCDEVSQFQCKNKRCVLKIWKCDGHSDCQDGSDETDCSSRECSKGMLACKDGSACYPERWLCDGSDDCWDGSDESNCTLLAPLNCTNSNQFQCANGICVDLALVCDRENDCGDNSDERGGLCNYKDTTLTRPNCTNGFICDNVCWPSALRCNGTVECQDESDEKDCDYSWNCKDGKTWVNKAWLCDGQKDCDDGSDEGDCTLNKTLSCTKNQYRCNTGDCIELGQACNGYPDCEDGSDESELNCKVCGSKNGGCTNLCQATPRGAVCYCPQGFLTKQEGGMTTCQDINECNKLTSCPQLCVNTKGSFKCLCAEGYISEKGGRVCRALGMDMKIAFITQTQIKGINLATNSHFLYANFSSFARSFTVNQRTSEMFVSLPAYNIIAAVKLRDIYGSAPGRSNSTVFLQNIERVDLLAVDWITRNLYYTQHVSDLISVCTYNRNCTQIVKTPYPYITDIAVDPAAGRLFVASFISGMLTSTQGGIWTYGLDGKIVGSNRLSGAKLTIPLGLNVDVHKRRVYWSDRARGLLLSNNYEGTNLLHVMKLPSTPSYVTNFQNILYWLNPQNKQISSYDISSGITRDSPSTVHVTDSSHSLKIIQEQSQALGTNPCSSAKCSHMCLLSIGGSYACACPTGYKVAQKDSNKCEIDPKARSSISPPVVPQSISEGNASSTVPPQQEDGSGNQTSAAENKSAETVGPTTAPGNQTAGDIDIDVNISGDQAGQSGISREPVNRDNDGLIAAIVISLVMLAVGGIFLLVCLRRRSQAKMDIIAFSNSVYNMPEESPYTNQTMLGAQVVQRGSIVFCDNPLFLDSQVETPGAKSSSSMNLFRRKREPVVPSLNVGNSPNSDFSSILDGASGASTPNIVKKGGNTNSSAYNKSSASIDYEDLTNQHLSVAFHKDKHRLISASSQ